MAVQTSSFTAQFDATPSSASANAVIGLSDGAAAAFTDLAVIVRFNPLGDVDARNGGEYDAGAAIPYAAGSTYHFRLVVDLVTHTYDAYVTPPGGSEVELGQSLAFRTEQASVSQLDNWAAQDSSAPVSVCRFVISNGNSAGSTSSGTTTSTFSTASSSATGTGSSMGSGAGSSGGVDPWQLYDAGPPVVAVTDDAGWTVFPGPPGTPGGYARAIYVDSAGGSDANSGASPAMALQHISPSSALYRQMHSAGAADGGLMILLKPGSVWLNEQLKVDVSGTPAYPLLVSGSRWPVDAGSVRPQIANQVQVWQASHIAFEGLQVGPGNTPNNGGEEFGIHLHQGNDLLVEDCLVTLYYNNIYVDGTLTQPVSDIRLRRNYIFGACGAGGPTDPHAIVGFDGENVASALFEENFFDFNGTDGGYLGDSLFAPYADGLAHDIYFAAGSPTEVIALNVTLRHNLFSRTLQSVKGPDTGSLDDNLFYNYEVGVNGGYIGTWGASFTNNVLINGNGFATGIDNNHGANMLPGVQTQVCNNLEYNEGGSFTLGYAFTTDDTAGVNLVLEGNIFDGFGRLMQFSDGHCYGYQLAGNVFQATSFYDFYGTWPQPQCPLSVSGNSYYSPAGATADTQAAFSLELSSNKTYLDFAGMESYVKEDGGVFDTSPLPFSDPTRNISSYLVSAGLSSGSPTPTLIDYLHLVQAQAQTIRSWNSRLGVAAINAYLRQGHSLPGRPMAYSSGCP